MISISLERGHQGQIAKVINDLLRIRNQLSVIRIRVWDQVNRYLEQTVLWNYIAQLGDYALKDETIERKKRLVRQSPPAILPRDSSGGTGRKAKAEFIYEYGMRTGFFMQQMEQHHPFGVKRFMIRELRSTVLGSQILIWGIKIDDFWEGYPVYILKGKTGSTSGGRGLISLDRRDLEEFRRILFFQYFLPALARLGTAGGGR